MQTNKDLTDKIVLGLVEEINVLGNEDEKITLKARIDSGAQNSSIDQSLAAKLKLGPILKNKTIRQSEGRSLRAVVAGSVSICGKNIDCEFTMSDRSKMTFQVLIGQDILKQGFIIDPCKYD